MGGFAPLRFVALMSIGMGFWTALRVGAVGAGVLKSVVRVEVPLNQVMGVDVFAAPWNVTLVARFSTILTAAEYHSSGSLSSSRPTGNCAIKSCMSR